MKRLLALLTLALFLSAPAGAGLDASKNFAKSTLSTGYTSAATSIVLTAGGGVKFPTPPFNAVWWNASDYGDPSDDPSVEIIRVTGISTDTLTVTRAQEGTSAANHNTAGKVYLLVAGPTAKLTTDILTINTTGSAAKWTTARTLAGNSVDGSANATFSNKFLVQGTADAGLSGAQFMGALGTGIVKNTVTTGVQSIAVAADFPTLNQSTTGSAATVTGSSQPAITSVGSLTSLGIAFSGSGAAFKVDDGIYGIYLSDSNTLNFDYGSNASNLGWINYHGYAGGDTQFRSFYIGNGKTGRIAGFDGPTGNVGIGTAAFGASAVGVLGIGNGTAPSTSPADTIQMWAEDVAASAELRVRDEAGNVTTLSPHNFSMFTPTATQIFPWSYYSKNAHIGKEINVDMYGAIVEIEKLSGKKFIYLNDLPADQIEDWTAQEAAKKIHVEKQRKDKAMEAEIEVVVADAVEVVTITMSQPSATLTETVTKYVLDATTGKVKAETVTTPKMETIDTPKTESRLKAGIRLDEKTGRFWRHVTASEAVVEPYVPKAPPAWIADRLAKK